MSNTARFYALALALAGVAIAGGAARAEVMTFSGSTTTSSSVNFQYSWENCAFSPDVCSSGSAPESIQVPFSFQIGLPSMPQSSLTSAILNLSLPSDAGAASIIGETSGPISTQRVESGSFCSVHIIFCLETTFYAVYNNLNFAPHLTFNGNAVGYVDSITSPGIAAVFGLATNAGSIDLLALGFGPDLLNGGDLTVSGFLELAAIPTVNNVPGPYTSQSTTRRFESSTVLGFIPSGTETVTITHTSNASGTGFNARTIFDVQYSASASESGMLTLAFVPEPPTIVLLCIALAGLAWKRSRSRRTQVRVD